MPQFLATVAVLAFTLTLAACGDDPSPGSSSDPVSIEVTIEGGSVTPSGERVDVERGQVVELVVTADAPGQIHVHSTPEQELEYAAGTTTLELAPLDTPGVVDVESHTLEKTIVQLEVR